MAANLSLKIFHLFIFLSKKIVNLNIPTIIFFKGLLIEKIEY